MRSSIYSKLLALLLAVTLAFGIFTSCDIKDAKDPAITITNGEVVEIDINDTLMLEVVDENGNVVKPKWSTSNDCVTVSINGNITALKAGLVIVTATYNGVSDKVLVTVIGDDTTPPGNTDTGSGSGSGNGSDTDTDTGNNDTNTDTDTGNGDGTNNDTDITVDPYENVNKTDFYASYTPAKSYTDATFRTKHGLMSGSITLPGQAPTIAQNRPTADGKLILNTDMIYLDGGKTYVVVDATGNEVMRIYYGGGYITLEEVAAYLYAFGEIPANYSSQKKGSQVSSDMWSSWGKYLRLNHSNFSGDTSKYPYEPELPNISGCGGRLQYKEVDIGSQGYNSGSSITRGALRIVYGRNDLNKNGKYDVGELYLFYTYNHYNDFQEYLNYYGGWGEIFGNVTGGGVHDSKYNCNPTPYVPVARQSFSAKTATVAYEYVIVTYLGYYTKQYI